VTSAEAILALGLRIIDEEGLDALSVRRLGDELGVAAMTVYTYVQTKDHLLDEVASLALNDLPVPDLSVGDWSERLAQIITYLYAGLSKHPGVTELIMRRPPPIALLDRFREAILQTLLEAGFSQTGAVDALTALVCYALGFAHAQRVRRDADRDEEASRLRALPPDRFPALAASAESYAGHVSGRAFELGLTALIDGLAVSLSAA
jgi:AcrR family transcriptional regulator